ncbi:MAG: hypothetical protein ACE5OZ_11445 [Candidatus Heimdallarchaeota archaeon]
MEIQIPHLEITLNIPELYCQCGWEGDRTDAEREHQVIGEQGPWISVQSFSFCPQCGTPLDLKVEVVPRSVL